MGKGGLTWKRFLAVPVLGLVLLLGGGLDKKLPPLEGLVRHGCKVRGPIRADVWNDPKGKAQQVWLVTFWAEHKPPLKTPWRLVCAYRKKRKKALNDCEKFMQRIEKARQKGR